MTKNLWVETNVLGSVVHYLSHVNLIAALIVINFVAFAAFCIDKMRANAQRRRVREATLLWFAFLGGTPGAYAGRALFRHKTRKQPFSRQLHTIAAFQLLLIAGTIGWALGG